MSVHKRKYGSGKTVWFYQFALPGATRQQRKRIIETGFATKKEAGDAEAARRIDEQQKRALAKSGAVVAAALPKTLSKLLEEFFTHHVDEKLAPKTVERYHQQAAYIHQDLLAMPIAEITPLHLNREWTRLSKCGGHTRKGVPRPMSPKTVRNIAGVVSSAFARAIRWGLVSANPVTNSEPPRVKKHLAIALTPAQQNMLVSAASGPWCMKAYLELDTATGCRRGELLALRWCDVAAGVAHISRSLTQTRGGVLQFKDTKTEKPRVVVLPQSAVAALETHRKQQDEFRRQFGSDYRTDLDLVFANPDGTPLKPDSISATVSALFKRLKIPKPKGAALHLLRHTHTSVLLSEGVPLAAVSARLGHSSVRTTQEIYAHMITGQDEEAAQKWEEYQKRNRPPTTKDWKGQVQ